MKILLVEDNRKVASFVSRALTEEGHVVDEVGRGDTALEQASSLPYDLVVLDWMLPGLDGLAVCRALRERGNLVPILMLTARSDVKERVLGLQAGADDYLPKPFDLGEFLARVNALSRRSQLQSQQLRVGPLQLDVQTQTATLDGVDLALTRREFALLLTLARAAGKPVPRTELLARVWQLQFDPSSNVVEAHIKNVREKLGARAALVETVRGVGYRLVAP